MILLVKITKGMHFLSEKKIDKKGLHYLKNKGGSILYLGAISQVAGIAQAGYNVAFV